MKKVKSISKSILVAGVTTLIAAASPADLMSPASTSPKAESFLRRLADAGAHFEPNAGQLSPSADFAFRARDYRMELTSNGIELKPRGDEIVLGEPMQIVFTGAEGKKDGDGVNLLPFHTLHRISNDGIRSELTEVPAYSEVRYNDVYSGIDVRYRITEGNLEYDFIVEPGSSPSQISIALRGVEEVRTDANNDLLLMYPVAEVVQRRPDVYQIIEGNRTRVEGRYVLEGKTVRIEVGNYDTSVPLVIDPLLTVEMGGRQAISR